MPFGAGGAGARFSLLPWGIVLKAVDSEFTSWCITAPMPIYEYRCKACNHKFSALIGMTAEPDEEKCPKCGSHEVSRLVSRFARLRTEDDRIDEMADGLEVMGEPDSPTQMRHMAREMGKAMDEDMADEMEEMFESDMEGTTGDED
jgi:putative FmdB family regulatory protein